MFYYDYVDYMNYTFYITIKDDFIYSLGLQKPSDSSHVYNQEKLLIYTTWLNNYFKGIIKPHTFKFNPSNSNFNNQVFNELVKVESGATITYKQLATSIGNANASRAVGNALSKNEILILIPCHRVIKSNGSLGGFFEGPILKNILLNIEKK